MLLPNRLSTRDTSICVHPRAGQIPAAGAVVERVDGCGAEHRYPAKKQEAAPGVADAHSVSRLQCPALADRRALRGQRSDPVDAGAATRPPLALPSPTKARASAGAGVLKPKKICEKREWRPPAEGGGTRDPKQEGEPPKRAKGRGYGETFDVFLSYSRTDAPAARQIQAWLKRSGPRHLPRSRSAPRRPAVAVRARTGHRPLRGGCCLRRPAGLGDLAAARGSSSLSIGRPRPSAPAALFPVIPILLPKVEDPPGGFLRLQTWVDLRSDLADPTQLHLLLTGLRGQAPADGSTLREALCPYRGLLPFREEDAGLFFGREEAIDTLLGKLRDHNFITVVGRSGSGKSSVVYLLA